MRLAFVVVVIAACSKQQPIQPIAPDPFDASPPKKLEYKSPDDVYAAMATVRCDHAVRCGLIGASERAECEKGPPPKGTLTLVWGDPRIDAIDMSWKEGRARFDPSDVDRCIAAWQKATCLGTEWSTTLSGCDPRAVAFRPSVGPGGSCRFWADCIDGHCSGQTACLGKCVAHKKIGQPCSSTGDDGLCEDGSFCDAGTCVAQRDVGAACPAWNSCKAGLECVGGRPPTKMSPAVIGHCAATPKKGEPCTNKFGMQYCGNGLACDFRKAPATCEPRANEGEGCGGPQGCADGLACTGFSWTKGIGLCKRVLDVGSSCDPSGNVTGCPQTAPCDPITSKCTPKFVFGAPCTPNGGCNSHLYCEPTSKKCVPRLAMGAACEAKPPGGDEPCYFGTCNGKTCVEKCP
ncbi:MAG: hypothetical protein ACXVEF_34885 [Polyangiales bacterium]